MAHGRKRIRNMVAGPYYAATFFSRLDPSASSSGTASAQEHVPESQSQGRSRHTTLAPYVPLTQYVPPAPYEPAPYYPQYEPPYSLSMISFLYTILISSLHPLLMMLPQLPELLRLLQLPIRI